MLVSRSQRQIMLFRYSRYPNIILGNRMARKRKLRFNLSVEFCGDFIRLNDNATAGKRFHLSQHSWFVD